MESFITYKEKRARVGKIIKQKKREDFKKFTEGLNKNTNIKYVWNKMKVLKNSFQKINWNSWQKGNREEVVEKEMVKLAPPWVEDWYEDLEIIRKENSDFDREFSMEELDRALGCTKSNSSPGLDRVDYDMIKKLSFKFKEELLKIFNFCFLNSYMMGIWKKNQVIFIDKVGKEKVRPITMSSCVSKVLERLINERLVWWVEANNFLDNSQNGFRKGTSCDNNTSKLIMDIVSGFYQNKKTIATFLDISSAYDNVIRNVMIQKLNDINCPWYIMQWINTWMRDRETSFVLSEKNTETRITNKGLPQGGVLSSILYAIYTKDLMKNIDKEVQVLQYADDLALYVTGRKISEMENKLENNLEAITKELNLLGLELAPEKCKMIDFNFKGDINVNGGLEIDGKYVKYEKEATFLGLKLDNKLSFNNHNNELKERVDKRCNILKFLCKVSWGMEVNTSLMVYKSFIRSVMDYASYTYCPADWKGKEKLEKMQYKGIRIAMGYRNSTPKNVMTLESRLMKIKDRIGYLARNFITRNFIYGRKDIIERVKRMYELSSKDKGKNKIRGCNSLVEAWEVVKRFEKEMENKENLDIYNISYWIMTNKIRVEIEIGKERQKKGCRDGDLLNKFIQKYMNKDYINIIYTDGSKKENSNSVGVAIVQEESDWAYHAGINEKTSIYSAEARVIDMVLDMYSEDCRKHKDLLILTDCLSVCKSLNNIRSKPYENDAIINIRKKIFELGKKCRIVIGWIPGHAGIKGNEIADTLANEARHFVQENRFKVTYGDWNNVFKNQMLENSIKEAEIEGSYKGIKFIKHIIIKIGKQSGLKN